MSNKLIPLLVYRKGATRNLDIAEAQVSLEYVPEIEIKRADPGEFGSTIKLGDGSGQESWRIFETPKMIEAAKDPTSNNASIGASELDLSAEAAGSAQGAGYAVSKYYTEIDTATDTSAEAVDLPAATVGKVHVVENATAVALEVFPASDESINNAADDAVYDQAANSTVYYYCVVAGEWQIKVA